MRIRLRFCKQWMFSSLGTYSGPHRYSLVARCAIVFAIALMPCWALPARAQAPQSTLTETARWNVRVENVTTAGDSLDVSGGTTGPVHVKNDEKGPVAGGFDHLSVSDSALTKDVKKLRTGDYITLVFSSSGNQKELKRFSVDIYEPVSSAVALVFCLAAGITLLLYSFLSGLHPSGLIIGEDNRYSNSKFQIALWFAVLITTYIATITLRVWGMGGSFLDGIDIPKNLLLISGMSAFTYGAAKGITTSKVNDAAAQGKPDPKASAGARPNLLRDLTHDDGSLGGPGGRLARAPMLDLGDFQMVVVTLLAVAVYLGVVWHFLGSIPKTANVSLPDVDTTILATFGLGQGAYLTKKAVGNAGQS